MRGGIKGGNNAPSQELGCGSIKDEANGQPFFQVGAQRFVCLSAVYDIISSVTGRTFVA